MLCSLFYFDSFSQTIKVEKGNAVLVTPAIPEQKQIIEKDKLLWQKHIICNNIKTLGEDISAKQKQLADLKAKLCQYDSVCKKLGYKDTIYKRLLEK